MDELHRSGDTGPEKGNKRRIKTVIEKKVSELKKMGPPPKTIEERAIPTSGEERKSPQEELYC